MTRRTTRLVLIISGVLALIAGAVFVRGTPLSAAQAPAPSFADVTVWGTGDLDPQTQALYQNLANAIAGFVGVPDSRWAYYGLYNDGTTWAIGSWGGSVLNAVPDGNGGYQVSMTVGPNFSISPGLIVGGGYYEIFNVDAAGVVTFIGSQDPNNASGGPLNSMSG